MQIRTSSSGAHFPFKGLKSVQLEKPLTHLADSDLVDRGWTEVQRNYFFSRNSQTHRYGRDPKSPYHLFDFSLTLPKHTNLEVPPCPFSHANMTSP